MLLSALAQLPLLRTLTAPLRRRRAHRRFATQYASFFGVFPSRAAALANAPPAATLGYDNDRVVPGYRRLLESQLARNGLESYEYPMLHWIDNIWQAGEGRRILDFGGNLGTHFHAFAKYLAYPADLAWWIVDVPPIVAEGRRLARERGADALQFAERVGDVPTPDLLIASGSLQYLDDPTDVVRDAGTPRHVLVNRFPLGAGDPFWTLQNGGEVFYAQLVSDRIAFIEATQALGYRLVDEWVDHHDRCEIPMHPERSVYAYSGFYFRRA